MSQCYTDNDKIKITNYSNL